MMTLAATKWQAQQHRIPDFHTYSWRHTWTCSFEYIPRLDLRIRQDLLIESGYSVSLSIVYPNVGLSELHHTLHSCNHHSKAQPEHIMRQ